MPTPARSAPFVSSFSVWPSVRPDGSAFMPAINANRPSGRLMANTDRQPAPSVSSPATTGPAMVDSPMMGPKVPNALPIS
jgi:hypothetical protein